jgi:hypothetical protein
MDKKLAFLRFAWFVTAVLAAMSVIVARVGLPYFGAEALLQGLIVLIFSMVALLFSLDQALKLDAKRDVAKNDREMFLLLGIFLFSSAGLFVTISDMQSSNWLITVFAPSSIGLLLYAASQQLRFSSQSIHFVVTQTTSLNLAILAGSLTFLWHQGRGIELVDTYLFTVPAALVALLVYSLAGDLIEQISPTWKNIGFSIVISLIVYLATSGLILLVALESMFVAGMMAGLVVLPIFVFMGLIGRRLNLA